MKLRQLLTLAMMALLSMPADAQKKSFEGEIEYKNTVTADKTLRKLYTWVRNGEYGMSFIRKWPDEKIVETYTATTSLILRSKDVAYVWSDLMKTGYKFKYSDYEAYLKHLHENVEKTVKPTGNEKDIMGYHCREYKGDETTVTDMFGAPLKVVEEHHYWVCEDYPDEYIGSTNVEGMPFYFEENARMGLPMFGEASQHQLVEISAIKERTVSPDELAVPKDVSFTEAKDGYRAQQKLAKEIRKYRKKNNIKDDGLKTEGVGKEQGEWDF